LDHAVNWEAISAFGQIVGALAVVISLIYLAREVRSSAHATRLDSERSVLDAFTRSVQQLTVYPDLSELFFRGIHDFESLKGAEFVRFGSFMHSTFRIGQEVYYRQLEGHLHPRIGHGLEAIIRDINTYPGVQAWWRSYSRWFGEQEFAKFINQLQQPATRHDD
jgi:hypothetical protein